MPVVADCLLQCLLWLVDVYDPKGHSWSNSALAIQKGIWDTKEHVWPEREF